MDDIQAIIKRLAAKNAERALTASNAHDDDLMSDKSLEIIKAYGVPRRCLDALKRARDTDAIRAVRKWMASNETILILAGGVGIGKSIAAAWWLGEVAKASVLRPGTQRRWWPAYDVAKLGMYYDSGVSAIGSINNIVLEDIGTEYSDAKGYFVSILGMIVNERYDRGLRTVMTTNLNPGKFRARYEERIFDRLVECGEWVNLAGGSMRGKK